MEYDEFIAAVRERIGTPGPEEAEVIVTEVLHALAHALPHAERRVLAAALPAPIGERLISGQAEYDPLVDEHLFIGYLMTEHQTTGYWDKTAGGDDVLASTAGEEVERRARAVLSLIAGSIPEETLRLVCDALPQVIGEWFRGEGEPVA